MNYSDFLPDYGDVLLPEDVQKILHIGRNTVYQCLKNQEIKSIIVGGKYKIPKYNLYRFMYPANATTEGVINYGEA